MKHSIGLLALIVSLFLMKNGFGKGAFTALDQHERVQQACKRVKELVLLPHHSAPSPSVIWTSFVDDLLELLDGISTYESLCKDLKIIRAPCGFRALKLIKIAKKLNNHQEIFKKMCEREEPISFKEGRQIAKYIWF